VAVAETVEVPPCFFVTAGLDPAIHSVSKPFLEDGYAVKPAYDQCVL
jgi:hypothetical protein